jgi:hypothetical protein
MRLEIVYRGGQPDPGLKRYVGLRLMSVLDQLEPDIELVMVRLDGARASGDDAGVRHRCRIVARLLSRAQVAVEHTDDGVYASIDAAADRLAALARLAARAPLVVRERRPRAAPERLTPARPSAGTSAPRSG